MNKLFKFLGVADSDKSLVSRIYFVFFCSGAMSTLLGALYPDIQATYGFADEVIGYMQSAHQIGNLAAVLLAGFLPFAIGRKQTSVILPSLIVIGLILTTLSGNPVLLFLAILMTGAGRGTLSNTTNVVVSECASNKTAGLNLLHATFAIGAFLSPFIAVFIGGANWKITMYVFAALMLIGVIFIATSSLSAVKSEKKKGEAVAFAKDVDFWIVTFILMAYLCAEASLMGWLVKYFQSAGILSPAVSKTMQSLLWIMILLGRLSVAAVSTRLKSKNPLILIIGVCMTLCYFGLVFTTNVAVIIPCLLGVGFFMGGIYPTTLSTQNPKYNSSTVATGVCIATASIGGIVWPTVVGEVAKTQGINMGMASILLALFAMIVLMIIKVIRGR